jgi:hypothetical protein
MLLNGPPIDRAAHLRQSAARPLLTIVREEGQRVDTGRESGPTRLGPRRRLTPKLSGPARRDKPSGDQQAPWRAGSAGARG